MLFKTETYKYTKFALAWTHVYSCFCCHGMPLISPPPLGENIAPWTCKLVSIAIGLRHDILHCLIKHLFKCIYSGSQAFTAVLSTNSTQSFSSTSSHSIHRCHSRSIAHSTVITDIVQQCVIVLLAVIHITSFIRELTIVMWNFISLLWNKFFDLTLGI